MYTSNMKAEIAKLKEARRPVRTVHEDTVEFFELLDSMDRMGQLVPILIGERIIDGHRRVRVAERLGWSDIDCNVRELNERDELIAQIRLNNLSLTEYRLAITRLIDENSLDNIGSVGYALGRNIDWVAEILGFRNLSPIIRRSVDRGLVHIKIAILLAKLPKGRQRELLIDSLEIPVSDLIPKLQQEVRHRYERKLDRRIAKIGSPDAPLLRSERAVINEVEQPIDAMRIITKENAKSALDGWQLALRWVLRLDSESFETRRYYIE